MKPTYLWLGSLPSPIPKIWFTKADAIKDGAHRPVKVQFRFCCGWADLFDGIRLVNGQTCPIHEAWLTVDVSVKHCIGMKDMAAVVWPETLAQAWRESFD